MTFSSRIALAAILVGSASLAAASPPLAAGADPTTFQLTRASETGGHGALQAQRRNAFACPGGYTADAVVFSGVDAGVEPSRPGGACEAQTAASSSTAPASSDAFVFDGPPLRKTMSFAGGWSLRLIAEPSASTVVVAVQDVGPASIDLVSITRVRLTAAPGRPDGKAGPYGILLDPADHDIPAGHRLRLSIVSEDRQPLVLGGGGALTALPIAGGRVTPLDPRRLAPTSAPRP